MRIPASFVFVPAMALVVGGLATPGCAEDTESVSLIEEARKRDERRRAPAAADTDIKEARAQGYVKREGLHIDMPYLAGRYFADLSPSVIEDQLGEVMIRDELPGDQDHIVCARAEVWLHEGRIYRIRKRLAHAMDTPTALGTSGFPLSIGRPIDAARELRWNRTFGMRRVQLFKTDADPRLVDQIEVWRFLPRELR